MISHYTFLKIAESATQEEIGVAYTNFKMEIGKYAPGIEADEAQFQKEFPQVWEAYQILMDPGKRKAYDEGLEKLDAAVQTVDPEIAEERFNLRAFARNLLSYIAFGLIAVLVFLFLYFLASYAL